MKKKLGMYLGVLMIGMLMVGCASVTENEKKEIPKEESSQESGDNQKNENAGLTSFEAESLDGEKQTQELFSKADLTMVNVWATFCGPCLREMPELGQLNEEYADQGVQIVGIVLDAVGSDGKINQEMVTKAQKVVEDTGANYVHLLPSEDLLRAGIGEIYSVPTTFFVDSKGNIVGESYVGARDKDGWKDIIEQVQSSM